MKHKEPRLWKLCENHYYYMYTFFFIILTLIIYMPFFLRGASFIVSADGFNQYYPVLAYCGKYYCEFFNCLIHGMEIPMYDFSIGFGDDIITTLNWFGFGDVFSLLSALVPIDYCSFLYTALILLKMYLAGLAFSRFCMYHKINNSYILLGAYIYTFSGYSLSYGMITQNFTNVMITLPFFALALDQILDSDKECRLSRVLVLTCFVQALSGFYFLYMELLFCVFYFSIRCFVINGFDIKKMLVKGMSIVVQCVLGISMAGMIFIPVLYAYINSPRSAESSFSFKSLFSTYSTSQVLTKMDGLLTGPGYETGLGILIVTVASILLLYSKKRELIDIKILLGIVLIGYWLPGVGVIMNGFSYSIDRWIFMVYFMLAYVTVIKLPYINEINKYHLSIMGAILLIWIMISFWRNGINTGSMIRTIMFSVIWIVTIIGFGMKKTTEKQIDFHYALFYLTLIGIVCIGMINNGPRALGGKGWSAAFEKNDVYSRIMDSEFAKISRNCEDEKFLRTDIYDTSINAALVTGTRGTSSYFSISNPSVYRFLSAYNVSSGILGSAFTMQGLDGRKAMEMVLSVDSYTDNVLTQYIHENSYALPFGYTYDSYMVLEDFDELDSLEKNALLTKTVVIDHELKQIKKYEEETKYWKPLPMKSEYMNIKRVAERLLVQENSVITVLSDELIKDETNEYYLFLEDFIYYGDNMYTDLTIAGKTIRLRPQGSYNGQQNDFLIKIPVEEVEKNNGKIDILFAEKSEFYLKNVELRELDVSTYSSDYQRLSEEYLQNVVVHGNQITGSLKNERPKILFMSIPYSKGWSCKIDGEKTEIMNANIGFSAIEVPEGQHKIEWKYETPGIHIGAICTSIGWGLFMIFCLMEKRRKKV